MNYKIIIATLLMLFCKSSFSQKGTSVLTDLSLQRNFKKEQTFMTIGTTVHAVIHITYREGAYISFGNFGSGRFTNRMTAEAKSPATIPQRIDFDNKSRMRYNQLSLGYNRYIWGNSHMEEGNGLYMNAGFGLIFGDVRNTFPVTIDTSLYSTPVRPGKAGFKRLSFDLTLGFEQHIMSDVYLYGQGKMWIPTTNYPSKYIFENTRAPLAVMIGGGLRVLF